VVLVVFFIKAIVKYQIFDFVLESNIALPELIDAEPETEAAIIFRILSNQERKPLVGDWLRHFTDLHGSMSLSVAKHAGGYLLSFPGLAEFYSTAGETEIECYPQDGVELGDVRHLLLNQVIPLLLSQQGELVLHASAVVFHDQAIGFLGEAGWGKSTLCASFCQMGLEFLTDDGLLLRRDSEQIFCYPSFPGLRLRSETRSALSWDTAGSAVVNQYRGKEHHKLNHGQLLFCTTPTPVKQLYILNPPGEKLSNEQVHITSLKSQKAFVELLKFTYDLDSSDNINNKKTFQKISEALQTLDIFRLSYPRDMTYLPTVQKAVLEHMSRKT